MITPIWVELIVRVADIDASPFGVLCNTFASPKSSTFTVPSSLTLMLVGFRSR